MVTLYADLIKLGLRSLEPSQGMIAVPTFLREQVREELIKREAIAEKQSCVTQEELNSADITPVSKDDNGILNESIDKIEVGEDENRSKIIEQLLKDLLKQFERS